MALYLTIFVYFTPMNVDKMKWMYAGLSQFGNDDGQISSYPEATGYKPTHVSTHLKSTRDPDVNGIRRLITIHINKTLCKYSSEVTGKYPHVSLSSETVEFLYSTPRHVIIIDWKSTTLKSWFQRRKAYYLNIWSTVFKSSQKKVARFHNRYFLLRGRTRIYSSMIERNICHTIIIVDCQSGPCYKYTYVVPKNWCDVSFHDGGSYDLASTIVDTLYTKPARSAYAHTAH